MGFSFVTEIPSPDVIRERFPLAPELAARKKERDEEIKKIITGESDKLLVVVGPCSADNEEALWIMCPVWSRCRRRRRTAW